MKSAPLILIALSISTAAFARKGDDIARTQEVATQAAQKKASEWSACLITNTRKYAPLGERVELSVDAAFGQCIALEEPLRVALLGMHMGKYVGVTRGISEMVAASTADADRTLATLRVGYRGQLIALVLEERGPVG